MRIRACVSATLMAALVWTPSAWAEQQQQERHIASRAAMTSAVADKLAADEANRRVILKVMSRSEVQDVANRFGLTLQRAETAVAHLSSSELAELAAPARAVEAELAGGDRVITISLTTLLLIIIVILLLAD